jgi:hypothetical protein
LSALLARFKKIERFFYSEAKMSFDELKALLNKCFYFCDTLGGSSRRNLLEMNRLETLKRAVANRRGSCFVKTICEVTLRIRRLTHGICHESLSCALPRHVLIAGRKRVFNEVPGGNRRFFKLS